MGRVRRVRWCVCVCSLCRPGSVMYVPAGYWHHVTCDSDEGSLSINFSMSTSSWLDLLMNSLGQHLWKYQHWRENIIVKVPFLFFLICLF